MNVCWFDDYLTGLLGERRSHANTSHTGKGNLRELGSREKLQKFGISHDRRNVDL